MSDITNDTEKEIVKLVITIKKLGKGVSFETPLTIVRG